MSRGSRPQRGSLNQQSLCLADGVAEAKAAVVPTPRPTPKGRRRAPMPPRPCSDVGQRHEHPHPFERHSQIDHGKSVREHAMSGPSRALPDTPSPPASKASKSEDTSKGAVVGTIGHVRCRGIKADGTACEATPQAGSPFCFFHDPEKSEERAIARRQGGLERSKGLAAVPEHEPDLPLASARDVVQLLGDTLARVRKGTLDPRIANSIGYLATVALRAHEVGDLEERIERLEAASNPPKSQRCADDWIEDNL